MLSVILYARNDNHGYNYTKRIAISINCIAEMLTHPNDEIVFIDYNTADDLPTVIESIKDTLTEKSLQKLKVFRVRKSIHEKYKNDSTLEVIEPIARNAAIRRTNPGNKWILSTNIDMIFVPSDTSKSLSDIVSSLEDGYYCLPRFEIPENLWEIKFKRNKPREIIEYLHENSKKLHLHSIIKRPGFLQFDNPGDFQLFLRKDIISIQGFDETMNKGWHVDSNIAKRLSMITNIKSFNNESLSCFHCNHTKKPTLLHLKSKTENCWIKYVESSFIEPKTNNSSWGLIDENLEEIFLTEDTIDKHLGTILEILSRNSLQNYILLIDEFSYNNLVYKVPRTLIYVLDHLYNLPKNSTITYIGYNDRCKKAISIYCQKFNLCFVASDIKYTATPINHITSENNLVWIFDFGLDIENKMYNLKLEDQLKSLKEIETTFTITAKSSEAKDRKVIGINVKHSDFEKIFKDSTLFHLQTHVPGMYYGYFTQTNKPNEIRKASTIYIFIRRFFSYLFLKNLNTKPTYSI